MNILYPENCKTFSSGSTYYWGSLFGSSDALALIEFAKTQQQVVLYVAKDITHYVQIKRALNFYNSSLKVLGFSNWEVLAFDHFSPHPDIVSSRLETLSQLTTLKAGIVITTLESLSQRLCPTDYIDKYSFSLNAGEILEIESFVNKLLKIGYRRVSTVMEQGEFNIKGALIDLYAMGAKSPYRIDLFDNEIDSIRTFKASTQRSIEVINHINLLPAREFSADSESISIFKKNYLYEFGNTDGFIYKEVSEGRFPGGIEFYLPLFFNKTNTLLDYLDTEPIIVYQKGFVEAAQFHSVELLDRFEHCKLSLKRLPLPINKVFLNVEELSKILQDKMKIQTQSHKSNKKESINFSVSIVASSENSISNKKSTQKINPISREF